MKTNTLKILIVLFIFAMTVHAQTIFSNGTGGGQWNVSSTWLGGVVPNANSDVIIASGDSVFTLAGAVCKNLTVYGGGIFATSVDTVGISQTLTLEDESIFYNRTTNPRVPGQERILEPNSTVVHSGSGTVGGIGNDVFGNLVINRSEGCTPATNLLIQGNLIVNNTANNVVFRGARPPTTGSQTHTVLGDVHVLKGILSCIDVGDNAMTCVWNIEGSVYVTDAGNNRDARIGPFSSANASGLGIFNIGGDLVINGGRLQAGTSSSSGPGIGIINLSGNLVLSSTAAVATNSLGAFALNFVGLGTQTVSSQIHFSMGTNVHDTVKVGSSVVFDLDTCYWRSTTGGEFVVDGSLEMKTTSRLMGAGSFTLNPGGTLKIGSTDGITLTDALGNIQVTGTRTYSTESNYEYKSSMPQVFGDALPSTLNGFAVNNPNGFSLAGNVNIISSLKMLSGDLDLSGNTITLGSSALLIETLGNTIKGSTGKITITRDINAPSSVNVGGLGATITSSANLGSTTVERYHYIPSGGGAQGISRVYNIVPSNNSGINAILKLNYDESELNGIDESKLGLFQSVSGNDNSWSELGGIVNTSQNNVELGSLENLSFFTLGDIDSPLPVEDKNNLLPKSFAMEQNYPNPFNPSTVIKYQVPENSFVTMTIYDVLGNEISKLVNQQQSPGYYSTTFEGHGLSSGLYIYNMKAGNFTASNKMILIK
jgi:hypothetical protein